MRINGALALILAFLCGCSQPEIRFEDALDAALLRAQREGKQLLINFSSPG